MTTLVTGATGFLGSHVARQLVMAGHSVRVFVRRESNLQSLEGLAVEKCEGDLRDLPSIDRAMKGVRRVFHVAADYRLWTKNPDEIYETNVEGTRRFWKLRARRASNASFTRAPLQRLPCRDMAQHFRMSPRARPWLK